MFENMLNTKLISTLNVELNEQNISYVSLQDKLGYFLNKFGDANFLNKML